MKFDERNFDLSTCQYWSSSVIWCREKFPVEIINRLVHAPNAFRSHATSKWENNNIIPSVRKTFSTPLVQWFTFDEVLHSINREVEERKTQNWWPFKCKKSFSSVQFLPNVSSTNEIKLDCRFISRPSQQTFSFLMVKWKMVSSRGGSRTRWKILLCTSSPTVEN